MAQQRAEEIAALMTAARAETLRLFDLAREEELHDSPGFGFRPIVWHLAHIGVFEAYWLLQKLKGEAAPDERYERIFDPINTPREESKNLPSRREMESYLYGVRERVLRALDETSFDEAEPLLRDGYVFQLVLEHEYQHQETLCYLLHMLPAAKKRKPSIEAAQRAVAAQAAAALPEMAAIAAGEFEMGASGEQFVYDNELPRHIVSLPSFKLDRMLTTNAEYAVFIAEGGYKRREWWSEEGWEWREREDWQAPLYWQRGEKVWRAQSLFDEGLLEEQHPVAGISWHEAEAYARFRGKRLPTEAEWERAAAWDAPANRSRRFSWGDEEPNPTLCNFNNNSWGTSAVGSYPAGASADGCLDMTGNVWEWTSDAFAGYPGFEPFPYPEYSQTWFDGDHRVLKGGSWATRAPLLRNSFRNFFRRHFRIAFAGIRCAADA
ncbi:MAG: gamma-glutamyl hercynylcysteine S-oxide synthase [Blastocatellia bacterium]|jgi:iron(II)-dependent oxidoreductase|nr:gamma-glutamyl hercynylcysteine S-oxide synthase [Blastocatellia bacterium]